MPSMYSITKNNAPSGVVPESVTSTTFGCAIFEAARASREPLDEIRRLAVRGVQDLERDALADLDVLRLVDAAHAALAEQPADAVAAADQRADHRTLCASVSVAQRQLSLPGCESPALRRAPRLVGERRAARGTADDRPLLAPLLERSAARSFSFGGARPSRSWRRPQPPPRRPAAHRRPGRSRAHRRAARAARLHHARRDRLRRASASGAQSRSSPRARGARSQSRRRRDRSGTSRRARRRWPARLREERRESRRSSSQVW